MRVTFTDVGALRPHFRVTSWDLVVVPLVIVAILLLTIAFQGVSQTILVHPGGDRPGP
jgi:NitT/TauT family transport system permease protein